MKHCIENEIDRIAAETGFTWDSLMDILAAAIDAGGKTFEVLAAIETAAKEAAQC